MLDNIYAYLIRIVVERDDDGSYYAHCPGLGGVHVSGDTEEEALRLAQETIQTILEIYSERRESLPESEYVIAFRTPNPTPLKQYYKVFEKDSFVFPVLPHLASKLISGAAV